MTTHNTSINMNEFLTTHTLKLTPLSPIHIGCGVDLEPTQFVVDDEILFAFNPAQVALNSLQSKKLMDLARKADLLGLQKFFKDNKQIFKSFSNEYISLVPKLAEEYEKKIGNAVQLEAKGKSVFNLFFLERTMHNPVTQEVYIPGSSVKGAMRTALVDMYNGGKHPKILERSGRPEKSNQLEARLIGDFDDGISRFVKLSDFMPTDPNTQLARLIQYAVNRKKRVVHDAAGKVVRAKGISSRKETICQAQYRAFSATLNLAQAKDSYEKRYTRHQTELSTWVQAINAYYFQYWENEMSLLTEQGRGFGNKSWCMSTQKLLKDLASEFKANRLILIRLGRHGGAESKTLSGKGVAKIKIMQAKDSPPKYLDHTKTIWLASKDMNAATGMFPFGWAIVEIDPIAENEILKKWCEIESKDNPNLTSIRQSIQVEREVLQAQIDQKRSAAAKEEEERQCQEAKKLEEEQVKQVRLSKLSEEQRAVIQYRDRLDATTKPTPRNPQTELIQDLRTLLERAQTWNSDDQKFLVEQLRVLVREKFDAGKVAKEFKTALNLLENS